MFRKLFYIYVLYFNRISYVLMTMYISIYIYILISARNIPSNVCVTPPEDRQVMLETCRGP
jgi:hypothetical protein